MDDKKKKKWKKRLIIFFSVCILCLLSVRIQLWYVRKEFENLKDIAYLLDCEFEWEEYNCYIISSFGSEVDMGGDYYIVTPFGGFFLRWIGFSHLNSEKLVFPRSIWHDFNGLGVFFYPTRAIEHDSEENGVLLSSEVRSFEEIISFNKGCSLGEVEKEFNFDSIEWLWVDTYGETDISQFEYFRRKADLENSAYGIPCSGYHNLESAAEHFIDLLNKYEDKQYLKTGKYLHKVKTGIKKEGEITLDDLVILGAEFKRGVDFNRESSIIRDVEAELNGEE